jgi:hypothetical protein
VAYGALLASIYMLGVYTYKLLARLLTSAAKAIYYIRIIYNSYILVIDGWIYKTR